ncbi:cell division protein FtsL [Alicyclobacillus sp.]|uniref:cell division protein FtsL n=1 Tax=Alicyclobacillus sp. TaxID=61169 RepID=UPI0025BC0768|nr:cell division protein FtsL [Alicyclobacillus sp.]MCL6515371.1 cell division protein FtsL [Alicyclobacillus sp.]
MQAVKWTAAEDARARRHQAPSPRQRAEEWQRAAARPWTHWDKISTLGCIALSAAVIWWVASQGAAVRQMSNRIDRLQTQIQRATAENASLSAQVDELSKPDRILGIAINQLHMRHASPVQIVSGAGTHGQGDEPGASAKP